MYIDEFVARANKTFFKYEKAEQYMYNRGFTKEDIVKYSIGYTKIAKIRKSYDSDYKFIHDKTYKFRFLENRIVIPLRNIIGKVNGLVVRKIEEKRYNIYLLSEAKKIGAFFGIYESLQDILEKRRVFVHEAALDAASFSKVFPNSISTLTSFINDEQYEFLTMLVDKIILVFDEDGPGQSGKRMLFKRFGKKYLDSISIGYSDSNKCLQTQGLKNFSTYIKRKVPILLH